MVHVNKNASVSTSETCTGILRLPDRASYPLILSSGLNSAQCIQHKTG